jgi:hypothetical protein
VSIHFKAIPDEDLGTLIRNTRSMSLAPESPEPYNALDEVDVSKGLALQPVFTGRAFLDVVNYPVIVEMWEKVKYGRHRRRWLAEFTQAERNKIACYHGRFYRWHLVSGTPDRVACRLSTLQLLQRAVAFFATI